MKSTINIWFDAVASSLETLLTKFAAFVPSWLAAIVILVVGYVISRVLRSAIRVLLIKVGIDNLAEATGVATQLARLGKNAKTSNFISLLIFWIVFLIFIESAADSMGLTQLGETIDVFITYIPKIIAGAFILLLGLAAASMAQKYVFDYAKAANFDFAKPLSNVAFVLVAVLTLSLTISQLDIDTRLLDIVVTIALTTFGVAAAISLGFGSKKASASIVYSIYVADAVKLGDKVTLNDGTKGHVVDIGAIVTTIRLKDESLKLVENQEFLLGLTIH